MRATSTAPYSSEDYWLGMATPFFLVVWVLPVVLLRAWVITKLWTWYVEPGFGVLPLRMSIAYGLSVLIVLLVPRTSAGKDTRSATQILFEPFFGPAFALLVGWIGSFFV